LHASSKERVRCPAPQPPQRGDHLYLGTALKFGLNGEEVVVRAGEVLCIPPDVPHEAVALEDTVDLDIFTPPREDWIAKTDTCLRGVHRAGHRAGDAMKRAAVAAFPVDIDSGKADLLSKP
jgi:hypothetical protein